MQVSRRKQNQRALFKENVTFQSDEKQQSTNIQKHSHLMLKHFHVLSKEHIYY